MARNPLKAMTALSSAKRIFLGLLYRDLSHLALLATVAASIGFLLNELKDRSLPLIYQTKEDRIGRAVAGITSRPLLAFPAGTSPSKAVEIHADVIGLERFRSFMVHKQGIVIDARSSIFYEFGHVPGALNLPRDDFEQSYERLKPRLIADKRRPLAVYCSSSSCVDSELVQRGLIMLGHTTVYRFSGGWKEWEDAKLPEEPNKTAGINSR